MLIECKNISASYENQEVLKNLNFKINKGDKLCVLGENGSGKSTLIKCLLGLKNVSGGEIIYSDGINKSQIGYLPQVNTSTDNFPASVYEVVRSGCLNSLGFHLFYGKKQREKAREYLKLLNIYNIRNECFNELSGGQRQRVLLARAMCATTKMLVLDEPVTGLDPLASSEFYKTVKMLNEEKGISIVMISHNVTEAMNFSTHILHLGENDYFFGSREEYLNCDFAKGFLGGGKNV